PTIPARLGAIAAGTDSGNRGTVGGGVGVAGAWANCGGDGIAGAGGMPKNQAAEITQGATPPELHRPHRRRTDSWTNPAAWGQRQPEPGLNRIMEQWTSEA
ncbi:MAG TPA: hypothetical protein IGR64_08010, partial [Leptolyngbyaceae cyanobacterium M65_K2018_010]|nr:hypothetical protein [Leptolyngbyaceae cyanobacterium M65_K2018_010]